MSWPDISLPYLVTYNPLLLSQYCTIAQASQSRPSSSITIRAIKSNTTTKKQNGRAKRALFVFAPPKAALVVVFDLMVLIVILDDGLDCDA